MFGDQDEAFSVLNTTVDFWRICSAHQDPDHPWKT